MIIICASSTEKFQIFFLHFRQWLNTKHKMNVHIFKLLETTVTVVHICYVLTGGAMLEQETALPLQCREYRRRWLMLAIFVLCSTANSMHWLQYSIIANIMMRYYNVSSLAINWTSMIYMACYIPFVFPASWVLDRKVCSCCACTKCLHCNVWCIFTEQKLHGMSQSLSLISNQLLFV